MARAPSTPAVKEEPLEKQLWKAADKLRKNIDAAEYKHVVLGLIFLKYLDLPALWRCTQLLFYPSAEIIRLSWGILQDPHL